MASTTASTPETSTPAGSEAPEQSIPLTIVGPAGVTCSDGVCHLG
jgi:hypothetical protein